MDLENLTPRLVGAHVVLEPVTPEHEEALFAALDFDEIWEWIPIGRPNRAGFAEFFASVLGEVEAGRQGMWITTDRATGAALGTSSYLNIRPADHSVEVGMTLLTPAAWGTGVNVEAKKLQLGHAFDNLGCVRVEFKTDSNNVRSRGALEALPAQFEGILRQHMKTYYGFRDSAYYSVTAEEWPEVRQRLDVRLEALS